MKGYRNKMESKLKIYLRDKSNCKIDKFSPIKFLIESNSLEDFETKLKDIIRVEKEIIGNLYMDIYIDWWGVQDAFYISSKLLKLIAKTELSVILDIND